MAEISPLRHPSDRPLRLALWIKRHALDPPQRTCLRPRAIHCALLGPDSRMLRLSQHLRQGRRRRVLDKRPAEPIGRLHKAACHVLAQ